MTDTIRVLYVDDEVDLLDLGKEFLEMSGGFFVDTAVSADTARTVMTENVYDAIVSDYQMPGEDGITFLKSVRDTHGTIPFILFTGRGREEVVIEAINNGVDFYLQKGGNAGAQFAELAHKIRHAVIRHQDAQRRKTAEEALRESEARFSLLFQSSPTMLALVREADNTFTDVNDVCLRNSGFSRGEIIGKTPESVGMFADSGTPRQIRTALQNDHQIMGMEVRFKKKSGEIHTCLFSAVMIAIGNEPYILSSAEDISLRKAMESELRESRCLLAEAMDLARVADWVFDIRTGMFTFNDRFYSLCGTTAEREGGYQMDMKTYLREFVHPDDRARIIEEVKNTCRTNEREYEYLMEHRMVRRDGAIRFLVVYTRSAMDAEGTKIRVHGANQDITNNRGGGDATRQSRLTK
jgi:PAS domain S-box-containing protein